MKQETNSKQQAEFIFAKNNGFRGTFDDFIMNVLEMENLILKRCGLPTVTKEEFLARN